MIHVYNLAGTRWRLNKTLDTSLDADFHINFISNGAEFDMFGINEEYLRYLNSTSHNLVDVYDTFTYTWWFPEYNEIEIAGGKDTINTTLIAWLKSNATRQRRRPRREVR